MKKTLLVLALQASFSAYATDYYVSACDGVSGQAVGCVAGNDTTNNGLSPATPWRTLSKIWGLFSSFNAGDRIYLAAGGSWSEASTPNQSGGNPSLKNTNTTAGALSAATGAVEISTYVPSGWGVVGQRAIWNCTGGARSCIAIHDGTGSGSLTVGGYVFKNLDIRQGGSILWGLTVADPVYGVLFDNVKVSGFTIGLNCYGDATTYSKRVNLTNSLMQNNTGQGILYSCEQSTVEKNVFDGNGQTNNRDHQVYLSSHTPTTRRTNVTFRLNSFINNDGGTGTCISVPLVAHGNWDGLDVDGNTMTMSANGQDGGCWAMAFDTGYDPVPAQGEDGIEWFYRLRVRNNKIINPGGIGIGCTSCDGAVIENNLIVKEGTTTPIIGISIPNRNKGAEDPAPIRPVVRNNTIYFKTTQQYDQGLSFADASPAATLIRAQGNVIYFGTASGANSNQHYCYNTAGLSLASNFTEFDKNTCFDLPGTGSVDIRGTPIDTNRVSTNPQLTVPTSGNGWDASPTSGSSPVVGTASTTTSAAQDINGCQRGAAPDRGAFEYAPGCTKAAAKPVGVR